MVDPNARSFLIICVKHPLSKFVVWVHCLKGRMNGSWLPIWKNGNLAKMCDLSISAHYYNLGIIQFGHSDQISHFDWHFIFGDGIFIWLVKSQKFIKERCLTDFLTERFFDVSFGQILSITELLRMLWNLEIKINAYLNSI